MALERQRVRSNEIRAPRVPRGTTVIAYRYTADDPKVALVHPADLAMLERSHELLERVGRLEPVSTSDLALKAHGLEDRPNPDVLVEDPDEIAVILEL